MNVVMRLEDDLTKVAHENHDLKKAQHEIGRENEKLLIEEKYLRDEEEKLQQELDDMHIAIKGKKDAIKKGLNEIIETGIKDEMILDETRFHNEKKKTKDLEGRLRMQIMRKEEIKHKMENIIEN